MKPNWHVLAARVAAQHPHWPWSMVCAEVARRKRAKPTPKPDPVARLEKRGLW